MRILSRVCADFYDKNRNLIHRIRIEDRNIYHDVPDAIQQDPLYQMLVNDGSILLADSPAKQKAVENDPMAGALPDGRAIGAASGAKSGKSRTATKQKTEKDEKSEPEADQKPESEENAQVQ